jgi:hypothetical protein
MLPKAPAAGLGYNGNYIYGLHYAMADRHELDNAAVSANADNGKFVARVTNLSLPRILAGENPET